MPKITRYPFFGKRFFRLARKLVGSCQFQHLWRMVVAIASMHGRRSLTRIVALTNQERTRQALSHFLTQAEWDAPEVLVADAKACAKRLTSLRLPSIQQLQETLRSQLWDDLIAHLETGQQTRVAALKIKELIQQ